MTDLELTKLCAEAMELRPSQFTGIFYQNGDLYDPLHDDAQAMALVKRFCLCVLFTLSGSWSVSRFWPSSPEKIEGWDDDLNRAICECVAKMQAAKTAKAT